MRFPQVTGSNLLRRKVTLPNDLKGELNILFIAFQQWHQALVDSWVPLARQLEQSFPGVQFYETPVIQKMNVISQTFINEGCGQASQPDHPREDHYLYIDRKHCDVLLKFRMKTPSGCWCWIDKGCLVAHRRGLLAREGRCTLQSSSGKFRYE